MKKLFFLSFIILSAISFIWWKQNPTLELTQRTPSSKDDAAIFEQFKNIKSYQDVEPLLQSWSKNSSNGLSVESLAYFSSHFLLTHKAFIARLNPIFETNVTTTQISVFLFKFLFSHLPENSEPLLAISDFLMVPDPNLPAFQTIEEVQTFLLEQTMPKLVSFQQWLALQLQNKDPINNEVLFHIDLTDLLGEQTKYLPTQIKRIKISTRHFYTLKAEIEKTLSILYYFSSYQLNQLPVILDNQSKKTAQKIFFNDVVKKPSLIKANTYLQTSLLHQAFKQKKNQTFLTLHPWGQGQSGTLHKSFFWLVKSLDSTLLSIKANSEKNGSSEFQSHYIQLEESLRSLKRQGYISTLNIQTGEIFQIHLKNLFNHNLSAIRDLKLFLPTQYETRKERVVNGFTLPHYQFGRAISWQDPSFAGVLPQTTSAEVREKVHAIEKHYGLKLVGHWLEWFL